MLRSLPALHRPESLRFRNALQRVLAARRELDACGGASESAYRVGHQHLARRGERRNTRRDVDRTAEDVAVLLDDVAGVQAEVQRQARVLTGARTAMCCLYGL